MPEQITPVQPFSVVENLSVEVFENEDELTDEGQVKDNTESVSAEIVEYDDNVDRIDSYLATDADIQIVSVPHDADEMTTLRRKSGHRIEPKALQLSKIALKPNCWGCLRSSSFRISGNQI